MTINFLGDSITEGIGADSPSLAYPSVCCSLLGAKEGNYGLGGTRIARQKESVGDNPDEDFLLRARWMNPCDFLFVFGGTNDYGHGDAPLGTKGDDTPLTFYGALRCLIDYLFGTKGLRKEQICFVLPLPRFNEDSPRGDGSVTWTDKPPLETYRHAIEEMCKEYGIETLRLTCLEMPATDKPSEHFRDGLHPNNSGHRLIGEELAAYLKKKGF